MHSRSHIPVWFITIVVFLAGMNPACDNDPTPADPGGNGGDDPPPVTVDTIPPAEIRTLVCSSPGAGSLALQWVAPGDDGWVGTAATYDIRYSKTPIDDSNWEQTDSYNNPPAPVSGTSIQVCRIINLDSNTLYFFGIKTSDEAHNESGLSNVVFGTSGQEFMPPAAVTDLSAVAIGNMQFLLTFTAPGDDGALSGTASEYDIRFVNLSAINQANWQNATEVTGEPAPRPAGELESIIVTVPVANSSYSFAVKTADEVPNWSGISNTAFGLGLDSHLWAFPESMQKGQLLHIVYRAPGAARVKIETNRTFLRECGQNEIVIVNKVPDQGTHDMTFDFINPDTGEYYRTGTYPIHICVGGVRMGTDRVVLSD